MSRNTPSPVLLTSLLPINPAIKPNTIHAKIDILYSPCRLALIPPSETSSQIRASEALKSFAGRRLWSQLDLQSGLAECLRSRIRTIFLQTPIREKGFGAARLRRCGDAPEPPSKPFSP